MTPDTILYRLLRGREALVEASPRSSPVGSFVGAGMLGAAAAGIHAVLGAPWGWLVSATIASVVVRRHARAPGWGRAAADAVGFSAAGLVTGLTLARVRTPDGSELFAGFALVAASFLASIGSNRASAVDRPGNPTWSQAVGIGARLDGWMPDRWFSWLVRPYGAMDREPEPGGWPRVLALAMGGAWATGLWIVLLEVFDQSRPAQSLLGWMLSMVVGTACAWIRTRRVGIALGRSAAWFAGSGAVAGSFVGGDWQVEAAFAAVPVPIVMLLSMLADQFVPGSRAGVEALARRWSPDAWFYPTHPAPRDAVADDQSTALGTFVWLLAGHLVLAYGRHPGADLIVVVLVLLVPLADVFHRATACSPSVGARAVLGAGMLVTSMYLLRPMRDLSLATGVALAVATPSVLAAALVRHASRLGPGPILRAIDWSAGWLSPGRILEGIARRTVYPSVPLGVAGFLTAAICTFCVLTVNTGRVDWSLLAWPAAATAVIMGLSARPLGALVTLVTVPPVVGVFAALLAAGRLGEVVWPGTEAQARREVLENLDGIKTAELGYHAAFDEFVPCESREHAAAAVAPGRRNRWSTYFTPEDEPGFQTLGWVPDGDEVWGVYWVETGLDENSVPGFVAIALVDPDGDGQPTEYFATPTVNPREGPAPSLTPLAVPYPQGQAGAASAPPAAE